MTEKKKAGLKELSPIDIYKLLPKINCKECGFPTCLAFAMKLAAGQTALDECPYVTDEVRAELAEASAPPIRGVTVGSGDEAFKVGEELVLFRHEKTFFNPAVLGVLISDDMDDAKVDELLEQAKECEHERVGVILKVGALALKAASGDAGKFKALVEKVKGASAKPLILMAEDVEVMKAGVEAAGDSRPLLYAADEANADVIVMGMRGIGGAQKLLLGSTSQHVLEKATVPVLIVPPAWRR